MDGFKRTISSGPGFRNSYNEKIISNANCLELIKSNGGNTIKTIKRWLAFLSLMTFDIKYIDTFICFLSDHLCAVSANDNPNAGEKCDDETVGAPLSVAEAEAILHIAP